MPEVANALSNGAAVGKLHRDSINNNISLDNGKGSGQDDANANGDANAQPQGGTSDWIDAVVVGEALGVDPASVQDIVVKAAVADGDNYCSCMWRVRASVDGQPTCMIVKAPPRGELMQDFVSKMDFFNKEAAMLTETLPAMRAVAAARCGPDHILAQQLGPKSMPCSVPGVLIMEDLSLNRFRNKERQGQLDMTHCKMALDILARLHALSVALYREDPASMDLYSESLFVHRADPKDEDMTRLHTETQLRRFGELAEKWEQTKDKGVGEKMIRLSRTIFDKMCDCVAPAEGAINVLNHGDYWINNMMFKYDGQESVNPKDIRLVDLQICRFASPALDLQYFITTSAQEEVRCERLDELLHTYRDHYNEYVSALGLDDARWSSLDALRDEYLSKAVFGFNAVYLVLCAVVAEPEDRLQLDTVTMDNMHEADFSSKAWAGSTFQRLLPKLLDYYVDIGVLE